MRLNESYSILKRDSSLLLVNIEDGDIYEINDVTEGILSSCDKAHTAEELANIVYSMYEYSEGDFSRADLSAFISDLVSTGIIRTE